MDPYYEQRLRDEVIYLHSLWHQGPPNRRNPIPIPNSTIRATPIGRKPQLPYPIAAQEGPTTKRKARTEIELPSSNKKPSQPDPRWECPGPASNDDSTSEWPSSGWPVTSAKLNLAPASAEEQLRHHALRLHNRALEACGGFFKGNAGSGSGSESEEEEEDCKVGDEENEEYKFLLNLFVEESGLRSYYEGNWDSGEFHCLVCGGLGKTKKIKGCVGLVHHAVSISKTKKKRAHRAFAQVVCRVLGWDFDRLPIVVLKGERLSFYLAKPGDERGEIEVNAGASEAVSGAVKDNVGDERDGNAESGEKEASNGDLIICQKSLKDDDANQCKETLNKGISEIKEEKEEAMNTRSEPELNVDQLDSALKDNVAAETDAPAESSEKEAFDDHQCNGKEPIICQSSLKDDGTEKSRESLDEGKTVLIKEAIGEEAKDALGEPEVRAGSCEGVFCVVKDNVAAENDANAELGVKEVFDDHQINSENKMICQVVLFQNLLKDDGTTENTEALNKGISEVEANKEDGVDKVEVPENGDDYKHDSVVSKETLDTISGYTGEIGSKVELEVALGDGTPMACELQAEPEKNVDGPNDDLNVFLENLEPL
ncbi:uncharacterized protein LOC112202412 isoform X2 [Rosa chinensis]|uniref:uncharacterized protein LOC112202412 isoform X2 n=1 Tax=Rosa chinensis TaxID=74649 RepID=UPI000D0967A9|nr:uncharacterized protein LOC112202412 isoform X2 [Rosa chinensis]